METKEDPTQYFEDLTAENEEGSQPTKKVGLPRKGHYSNYTHFISIPLIGEEIKAKIFSFEKEIISQVNNDDKASIKFQSPDLLHLSLAMLNLKNESMKKLAQEALLKAKEDIKNILKDQPFKIQLGGLEAFMDKKNSKNSLPKLLYINLIKSTNADLIDKVSNCIIRAMLEKEVIDVDNLQAMNVYYDHTTSLFKPMAYHATFMRIKNTPERKYDASSLIEKTKENKFEEYNIERLDISTRFEFGEDKFYKPLISINL